MRIEKDITKQGYWWLPENPENTLFGILKIQDDGLFLRVSGLLRGLMGTIGSNTVFEYEKILGEMKMENQSFF